jgi:signal transduction histidine kinase
MGYLTTTLDCFLQALPYFEKSGTPGALSKIYDNIQLIYHDLGQYDKGIEYGEKSLAIVADHPDSPSRGIILANLSINYKDVSPPRFDDALNALREALQIAKLNGKKSLEAQCHANTGAVCYYMQKYDLAREHYLKAIGLYEKTGKQYALHTSIKGYAQCEKQLGNYREAQKLFEKVLAVAQESELRELESECYDELSYLEVLTGRDMKKNQRYLLKADSVRNLILNDKLALANAELEVKYELSKKEFEISRQQAEIKRQNMIRTFLAAGLSLTILALILLWQALRLRNRRNRTLGELNTALADRNHALDEMNATKDKFFNIISHDLRNPALAQRNALQALLEHSGQWDVATLKEFYRELLDSADSNVELLNNLLNWAQVQTGRIAFKPAATDLSDAFRNEIRLIRRMAEQKGIRFNVEIPPGAVVVADPRMLAVIVRNLLANAVKFTPEGGTVTLSAETAEEQKIEIAVADTGMGMTPEQIKSLFHLDRRPSQPLPSSLRQGAAAGEQGTGLGLIVCSEMLEYHGCILQIESLPDQGSRFRFTLPAQSPRGM